MASCWMTWACSTSSKKPTHNQWACCSSNGDLHFSSERLNLNPDLWDEVIVHEFLHLSLAIGRLWKALRRPHLGDWESPAERLNPGGPSR